MLRAELKAQYNNNILLKKILCLIYEHILFLLLLFCANARCMALLKIHHRGTHFVQKIMSHTLITVFCAIQWGILLISVIQICQS